MKKNVMKRISILLLAMVFMFSTQNVLASNGKSVSPYAKYISKTGTGNFTKRVRLVASDKGVDEYVTIKYTIRGYYTCDRASGEIISAYATELPSISIQSPAYIAEAFEVKDVDTTYQTPTVSADGSNAKFTVTFNPTFTYIKDVFVNTYTLPAVSSTLTIYAS